MKEIAIADVSYWTPNIQNIKEKSCHRFKCDFRSYKRADVHIPFYFIENA